MSETTHFLSVFCEAGVVQQCVEAQGGVVQVWLKEVSSLARGSFALKYEGKGFRKVVLIEGVVFGERLIYMKMWRGKVFKKNVLKEGVVFGKRFICIGIWRQGFKPKKKWF